MKLADLMVLKLVGEKDFVLVATRVFPSAVQLVHVMVG